jgi:hypothetical protein
MTSPAQSSEIADLAGRPRYSCPKCKSENVRLALLPYAPEHTVCGFLGYLIDGVTVDVWMVISATCRDCNHEDEPYRFRHMPRGRPTAKKRPTPPYRSYVYTCPHFPNSTHARACEAGCRIGSTRCERGAASKIDRLGGSYSGYRWSYRRPDSWLFSNGSSYTEITT